MGEGEGKERGRRRKGDAGCLEAYEQAKAVEFFEKGEERSEMTQLQNSSRTPISYLAFSKVTFLLLPLF